MRFNFSAFHDDDLIAIGSDKIHVVGDEDDGRTFFVDFFDGILTQSNVYEKTISNLIETKTRGAHIICVVSEDKEKANTIADDLISIPNTAEYFMTSLAIIPLQLLSYYVSVQLGLNVDKPRNLAKSVTVE